MGFQLIFVLGSYWDFCAESNVIEILGLMEFDHVERMIFLGM